MWLRYIQGCFDVFIHSWGTVTVTVSYCRRVWASVQDYFYLTALGGSGALFSTASPCCLAQHLIHSSLIMQIWWRQKKTLMTNGQEGCMISGVKLRGGCFVGGQRTRSGKTEKQKKPCWQKKRGEEDMVWLYTHTRELKAVCEKPSDSQHHVTHFHCIHLFVFFYSDSCQHAVHTLWAVSDDLR